MSLAELIRSVAHKAQSPSNHSQVTPVTPLKNTVLPLQPAPQAEVTPVTPVTPEKTNVEVTYKWERSTTLASVMVFPFFMGSKKSI